MIAARILCGACAEEHRPADVIGRVERRRNGIVLWVVIAKWRSWLPARPDVPILRRPVVPVGSQVLSDPRVAVSMPHRLYGVCGRHGEGSVSTADVIGKRGRIIVDFTVASA